MEGLGHPFGYSPESFVEDRDDEDAKRMVREYDPDQEFVIAMLKHDDRMSTRRVQITNAKGGERS